jgi:esterase/lipase
METRKTCKYLGHTVSELRFKTGNYRIWSPPVFANFLLVISHNYITTYFLTGVSCGGCSGASHNLTYNPHMLHHSQAAMHNF